MYRLNANTIASRLKAPAKLYLTMSQCHFEKMKLFKKLQEKAGYMIVDLQAFNSLAIRNCLLRNSCSSNKQVLFKTINHSKLKFFWYENWCILTELSQIKCLFLRDPDFAEQDCHIKCLLFYSKDNRHVRR